MKSFLGKFLNYGLYFVSLAAGLFVSNGDVLFGSNPQQHLTLFELRMCTGIFLLLVVTLFLINIKNKSYKPHWIMLAVFLTLGIVNAITIATFKNRDIYQFTGIDGNQYFFTYNVSLYEKSMYIIQVLVLCLTSFVLIDFGYQLFDLNEFLKVISFGTLGIVTIFLVVSYATEWDRYVSFLPTLFSKYEGSIATPESIFMNSNVYSVVVSMALIALIYLHIIYKKWYLFIGIAFLYVNIFFIYCKTLIFLDLVLIIAYLIYYLINQFTKSKKSKIITTIIVLGFLAILLASGIMVLVFTNTLTKAVEDFLNYRTIQSRTWIWMRIGDSVELNNWIFGIGYSIFNHVLNKFNITDPVSRTLNNTGSAHNSTFEFIGQGGIFMLIVIALIFAMTVFVCIKNLRKNRDLLTMSIFLMVFSIVYSLVESAFFILPETYSFALMAFYIMIPALYMQKQDRDSVKCKLLLK